MDKVIHVVYTMGQGELWDLFSERGKQPILPILPNPVSTLGNGPKDPMGFRAVYQHNLKCGVEEETFNETPASSKELDWERDVVELGEVYELLDKNYPEFERGRGPRLIQLLFQGTKYCKNDILELIKEEDPLGRVRVFCVGDSWPNPYFKPRNLDDLIKKRVEHGVEGGFEQDKSMANYLKILERTEPLALEMSERASPFGLTFLEWYDLNLFGLTKKVSIYQQKMEN